METPVTLFFGNVAHTLPDSFINSILKLIGNLTKWRRAINVKGEPCDFGFADFSGYGEAIKALKIGPNIKILGLSWIVTVDKSVRDEIDSYHAITSMKQTYNEEKERIKMKMSLEMIKKLIEGAYFARAVPRLQEVIQSPNDGPRESEHFKYLADIRKEDDDLERKFREQLISWKILENNTLSEFKTNDDFFKESKDRNQYQGFLKKWKRPTVNIHDNESINDYLEKWKRFNEIRKIRKTIRTEELEFELNM